MLGNTNAIVIGNTVLTEKINLTITSNQSSTNDLIGTAFEVIYGFEDEYVETYTWEGNSITLDIPQYVTYTISFGEIPGYKTPENIVFTAIPDNVRQINVEYQTEVVTVTVSAEGGESVAGQAVTINGITTTLTSLGVVSQKIPYGTTYSISVNSLGNYNTPATQTFTAGQVSRSVSMVYAEIRLGIYIQDIVGRNWTYSEWDGSTTPNGIAVITENCEFVIALSQKKGIPISLTDVNILTVPKFPSAPTEDYSGKANTEKLVQALGSDTSLAAGFCTTFTFPNGKKGYLGSAGEWVLVHNNLSAINQCLSVVNSPIISDVKHWTSTRANDLNGSCCFWAITPRSWNFSYHYTYFYIDELSTRPFTTLR